MDFKAVIWDIYNFLKRPKDNDLRFKLMVKIAGGLFPQYRFKWPQLKWWQDPYFNEYLKRFGELDGFNSDRRWMLSQLLRLTFNVPGDTAECGVFLGASSYIICKANSITKTYRRWHYMFDSFEGLSAPSLDDGKHWEKGSLRCDIELAKRNLKEFKDITFLKGWIPDRFKEVSDKRFSFVHIDVDLYQPTIESIRFFYERMNKGGIILCDDYGFLTCPGATKAVDDFLSDKEEKIVDLSCGGGFLIKGIRTGESYI